MIGGNGSQSAAHALTHRGVCVIGVASTIDNDLVGADMSIGATTALDVALEAIDRLRVTASSHKRVFLVEVMGRDSGHLALIAGLTGGAEAIVLPGRLRPTLSLSVGSVGIVRWRPSLGGRAPIARLHGRAIAR